jgi:hypothetical protein
MYLMYMYCGVEGNLVSNLYKKKKKLFDADVTHSAYCNYVTHIHQKHTETRCT